jgi:predicted transcriptional regulator
MKRKKTKELSQQQLQEIATQTAEDVYPILEQAYRNNNAISQRGQMIHFGKDLAIAIFCCLGRNLKKFLNVVVRIDYLNILERANRWIKELCKFTVMFSVLYFATKITTSGIQMIADTRQHLIAVADAIQEGALVVSQEQSIAVLLQQVQDTSILQLPAPGDDVAMIPFSEQPVEVPRLAPPVYKHSGFIDSSITIARSALGNVSQSLVSGAKELSNSFGLDMSAEAMVVLLGVSAFTAVVGTFAGYRIGKHKIDEIKDKIIKETTEEVRKRDDAIRERDEEINAQKLVRAEQKRKADEMVSKWNIRQQEMARRAQQEQQQQDE